MYHPIQLTIRIPSLTTSKNGSPSRLRFFLIPVALVLACFTLSPAARAVIPAPDGGYFNNNTAEGEDALFNLTTGGGNTATGVNALFSNSRGSNNIGLGIGAGGALTTGDNNIDIGNSGVAGETAKIRIGTKPTHKNTYIAGIYGVTVARG